MDLRKYKNQIAEDCFYEQTADTLRITHYWKSQMGIPLLCLIGFWGAGVYIMIDHDSYVFLNSWIVYLIVSVFCLSWIAVGYFGRTTVKFNRQNLTVMERGLPFLNFQCSTKSISEICFVNYEHKVQSYVFVKYNDTQAGQIQTQKIFRFNTRADAKSATEVLNEFFRTVI